MSAPSASPTPETPTGAPVERSHAAGIEVVVTEHGRAASHALVAAVRAAKAAGALAPVTVVVPSNFAGLAARRLLGSGLLESPDAPVAGIANVNFLTPFRLAELLAVGQLRGRRPLTNPVLGAAVRRALAENPREFTRVRDHQATEQAVAAAVGELSNVGRIGLDAIREAGGFAASVVELHLDVQSRLADFHDEADVARAASSREDLPAAVEPFGPIIWYLPGSVTAPLALFLRSVLAVAPSTVIVGRTGDPEAEVEVDRTLRIAGVELSTTHEASPEPPLAHEVVSVTDADDEVRQVVREVVGLVEHGVSLSRIGIFHPVPDPYVRLLEQHLSAAGVAANGPSRRRLAETLAGRVLLGALALPGERWRRDRVIALLSTGPIRHRDSMARGGAWDIVSRDAGVVAGLADWRGKLAGHDERLQALSTDAEHEGLTRRVESIARTRADLVELMAFLEDLDAGVAAVARGTTWADRSQAGLDLLRALLGPAHRHGSWPEREQVAFESVEAALERLGGLDELDPEPTMAVFTRALTAELSIARERSGRFGDGVLYGPLTSAVGHDLDAVFVLGCAEGLLPAPRREDALIADRARALTGGDLPPRLGQIHEQHRLFLAALAAAPPDRRWLFFPRGDLRSSRRARPSRWLLPSAAHGAGKTLYATDFEHATPRGVVDIASHADGIRLAAHPASLDERDLGTVLSFVRDHGDAGSHPAAGPAVRAGLDMQRARRSGSFTAFDGNLAGQPLPTTHDRPQSPSRLEAWAACGFRYFLAHVLDLGDRDDPERTFELSALDRGSAIHEILETFLRAVAQAGAPGPDEPWSVEQREQAQRIAHEVFDEYERRGRTGRAVVWGTQKSELLASVDEFLTADDRHRSEHGATPARFEEPFGLAQAPAVEIPIADGRRLRFRGVIDRIDTAGADRMIVSDYKTGRGGDYKNLDRDDPTKGGTLLQLGLYAEAAGQLHGAQTVDTSYWMVNARAGYERLGYEWTEDRRARLTEVVDTIVRGIESGVFAAAPGEWDNFRRSYDQCRYCDFDSLCPRDRAEQADAKATAPELGVRVALTARPDAEGEGGASA